MRLAHERQMAEVKLEADKAQAQVILSLVAQLSDDQKSIVAADLIQRLTDNAESVAGDAKLGKAGIPEIGSQEYLGTDNRDKIIDA